jgi:hypothetical protein
LISSDCSHSKQVAPDLRRISRRDRGGARLAHRQRMDPRSMLRALLVFLFMIASTAAHAGAGALSLPDLTPLSASPPVPELGAPRLHVESEFPITLHELAPFAGDEVLCQAPCTQIVDGRAGQRFYFSGDEIPPSISFALAEKSGDVLAAVHKGSFGMLRAGHALITPAVLHLLAGAVLLPIMSFERDPQTASDLRYATVATLTVGTALLVTSIVMVVEGKTTFRFDRL